MDATRIIHCRFCQSKNNLPLHSVFQSLETAKCGRCHGRLFVEGTAPLPHLCSTAYEHPADRQTLESLQKIPGIDSLLKHLLKESYERANRLYHRANAVAVTSRQFPRLHQIFLDAAFRLDLQKATELFVVQSPLVNSYISGVDQPFVVVTTGLLELMTDDEILYTVAHELGHWQAHHILYKTASRLLSEAASALAEVTLGIGRLLTVPVQLALLRWDRCSELTADRAGLLAVRRVDVAIRTFMKLAGGSRSIYEQMDYQAFLQQAEALHLDQEDNALNKTYVLLQEMYRSHPFPVWRAAEILRWAKEGAYLAILAGQYATTVHDV
jgi:Zn-dependent protease with chaperone function